jgi:hypothetical protein
VWAGGTKALDVRMSTKECLTRVTHNVIMLIRSRPSTSIRCSFLLFYIVSFLSFHFHYISFSHCNVLSSW